jgi:cell fate regulator YaaT (PSP1 superfamily)
MNDRNEPADHDRPDAPGPDESSPPGSADSSHRQSSPAQGDRSSPDEPPASQPVTAEVIRARIAALNAQVKNSTDRETSPSREEDSRPDAPDRPEDDTPDAADEDDTQDGNRNDPTNPSRSVVVRYGLMQFIGEFRHNLKTPPRVGQHVVVRTERGVELGEVISRVVNEPAETCQGCSKATCITQDELQHYLDECGGEFPFTRGKRLLRMANQQDLIDHRHLQDSAKDAARYCREQILHHKLGMKLVTVEHLLGGERIVFYFTAEKRVDFRSLVRDLAGRFRTRIEMRQVGARDEARLVGDYERCGQRCCCQQFLKDLKPVSMRMAKVQKATLDPTKISGRCGRLMCCLRYEDETYEALRKNLPRRNSWVRTDTLTGRVLDTQIITQLVRLALPDGTLVAVGVEEIIERNLKEPTEEQMRELAVSQAAARREQQAIQRGMMTPQPVESSGQDDQDDPSEKPRKEPSDGGSKSSKRRRRRRKKKKPAESGGSQQGKQQGGKGSGGRKGRRRRRRKKGPGSAGGSSGGKKDGGGG